MTEHDDKLVNIEVDGVSLQARAGQMLIEVTDQADIYVPRFCYHSKLSVAANCRMCLVEVEKAPKPLPACATPVAEGMKVFTRSSKAIVAQKSTMEFLLINHPLDCPICDQGGECELQDLAMGFGRGVSRYAEHKRVVKDKSLGALISTDMTRCIHCTRCVRFGQEIAGIQELGAVGRSDTLEIGTYIEKSVDHELSGNIIDLCPVGALNNKPYRFSARAWEMHALPTIAPHDCAGSNLYAHVQSGRLRRVVPRDNDAINETWISDRDRFSCFGIYSQERLEKPMVKRDQEWFEVTWPEALQAAVQGLRDAVADEGDGLGVLASPNATLEELHLLRRIASHLGSANLDYRLRRSDFRDQNADPVWPSLGVSIAELDEQQGILLVGSNLRMEVPILAHRIRNAALAGAEIAFVNPVDFGYQFKPAAFVSAPFERMAAELAGVLAAAAKLLGKDLPAAFGTILAGVEPDASHQAAAKVLFDKDKAMLLLGHMAQRHPNFSDIRVLAAALAEICGAGLGYLSEGANAAGAALAGFVPHRCAGGEAAQSPGLDVQKMLSSPRHAYLLFGVEPDQDLAASDTAEQALNSADTVVAFGSFVSDRLLDCADILLPIGTFAETDGTFVNVAGTWQSFSAAADLVGEARPGWRILRVLANELEVPDSEYFSAEEIRDELRQALGEVAADNSYQGNFTAAIDPVAADFSALDVPIYAVDSLVRRADALQQTVLAAGQDDDAVEQAVGAE